MTQAIAMEVIFWGALGISGVWLLRAAWGKSTIGTRYRTEKACEACRGNRDIELRKIRVLLHQVAYRLGVDPEFIEEIIK